MREWTIHVPDAHGPGQAFYTILAPTEAEAHKLARQYYGERAVVLV